MFEFNGEEYSLAQITEAAKQSNMALEDYIKEYNIIEKLGKTTPTTPGAVVEETAAPELTATVSPSVDISLALPEQPKTGTSAQTEFIPEPISKEREEEILSEYDKISNIDIEQEAINKKQSKLKRFQQGEFKLEEKEEFNYWKSSNGKLFEESQTLSEEEIENKKQANQSEFLSKIPAYERQEIFAKNKKVLEEQTNFVNKSTEKRNNLVLQYNNIQNTDIKTSEDFIYRRNLINQIKFEDIERRRALSNLNRTADLVDDFKRSYAFYDIAEQSFKTIGADIAIGAMSTIDMLKTEEGKKISYLNELVDYREGLQQFSEENLAKPISIENVDSLDKAFYWGVYSTANQLPTLAMAFTGQAAIPLFFATGYGSKMSDFELGARKAKKELPLLEAALELEQDPEKRKEIQKNIDYSSRYLNVSDGIKLLTSTAHGFAESFFEGLTTLKLVRDLQNIGANILKASGSRKAIYNAFKAAPMSIGLESLGESATQITQNAADILIFKDDKSLLENVPEAAAQGALFGSGFAIPNLGTAINAGIQSTISTRSDKAEIKNKLKEINDLTFELQSNDQLTSENKKELQKNIQQKINELVRTTDITRARFQRLSYEQQQEVFDLERQVNNSIRRWRDIGASNMSEGTKNSLREEIKNEIQSLQDKKQALLESGDARLKELKTVPTEALLIEGDEQQSAQQYFRWKQGIETFIKKYNLPIKVSIDELTEDKKKEFGRVGGSYSNRTIIIYENEAIQSNPSTPLHELTHAMLEIFGLSKENFDALEKSFEALLQTKKEAGEITDKQYNDTIKKYKLYKEDKQTKENASEELLTSFTDAIAEKALDKKDTSFLIKIGKALKDIISSKSSKIEAENFDLNTAEGVYNFLTQFTESVAQGKKFKKMVGVEIPEELKKETKVFSKSISGDKIQEIFDEKGKDGAFEIIEAYKPLTTKLTNKYRNVPGFDFELLQSEIEIGKRGLLDLINAYNPSKGATLNTYIQGQLTNRSIEAANRILDTDFKLDVTEAKSITDTTTEETIEAVDEAQIADEIKSLRKEIGLPGELVNTVKNAVIKTFGTKLPNPQDPKFRLELQRRFRTELKKPLAKFVGKQADYESFLRNNFQSIYNKLPQSLINRRFKDFQEPVLDKNGKHVREKTAEGNKVYTKKKITPAEWVKYFLGTDVGRSTQGTRKTAIVEAVAEEIAFDATMEVLQSPDVINKYQDIAGITGEVLPENFKAIIAKQIDRAEDFKFSKSLSNIAKEEYNLEQQELARILDKNNLNSLSNKYSLLSDNIIYEADPANIKFSLTTKADGKWTADQLNPLDESRGIYKFKVGEIDYEINAFKDPLNYNYDIFEQTEGIEDGAINNDPKSWGMTFASATTRRVGITGYALKGLTNQFKVLGTVANATIDLIKKEKLNSITFTAKEESRKRLYRSLNQKFASELGWKTYDYQAAVPDGEETIFIAYNPNIFKPTEKSGDDNAIKFSKSLSEAMGLTEKEIFGYTNFNDVNLGRIGLAELSEKMVAKLGIEEWVNIIDPLIARQYKPKKDDRGIDIATDFTVAEEKFKKYEGIFFRRTKIDGEYRTAQFLTLGRKDYYEVILAKAIGENVKWDGTNLVINNEIIKRPFVPPQQPTPKGKKYPGFSDKKGWDSTMEERINFAINQRDGFKKIVDVLTEMYNNSDKTRNDKAKVGMVLNSFNSSTDALVRTAAIPGLEMRIDGLKDNEYRYEHTQPAAETLRQIARLIIGNKNAQSFDEIMENFRVAIIPKIYDNIINKTVVNGKLLKSNSLLDKNGNLKKPTKSTLPTRYEAASKNILKAGLNPLNLIDNYIIEDFQAKYSKSLNRDFNKILEQSTGVDWKTRFSPVQARIMGKGKGRKFFIPYSADDFVGLLYTTLGRKEVGEQQMEWYKENLLRPFSRGIQQYEAAKQQALREWQILKKEAKKNVPGGLDKKNATGLTNQDAVRLYMWKTQGMEIPGVKGGAAFVNENLKIVRKNPELKAFAERLMALNPEGYPEPSANWDSGDITTDIVSYINNVKRSEFLTEWKENVDEIFSDQNKEKLRALYGDNYIEALEDILYRMRTGTNRKFGISKVERQFMDWTNNSVGAIMFFNARSAVLQTLSAVNFINFTDNNPINAGAAFFNQKQYWNDFSELFNSDFLKQRRSGLQTDVNADEIARAAKGAKNTARAVLSALLKFGFTPTQIADSFAIASGGATFYRNRIKTYLKEGMSEQDAKAKAFTDFQEIAEETQQSARPDRISLQQASSLGRLILAFGNTPMQYARLTKKATLDLINGRGDWKTNMSKIMYYSVIQNIIFSALQQGLFALLFDDEDDDKEKSRLFRIGNSSLDTLLRGVGVYGAAAATLKNMILEIIEQSEKSRPDYKQIAIEATAISPPINSKLRKLESAGKTFTYKQSKEKVFTEGFSLENPAFLAGGKVISALTNLPADRVVQKADHIYTAMQPETELWQSIALSLGWSEWDLNMIEKQTKKGLKRSRTRSRTRTRTRKK